MTAEKDTIVLKRVQVSDYKSIRNSNSFSTSDVTCLVGKNEAGKTAILEALYRLNPIVESHGVFDVVDDYPRAEVEEYQQRVENDEEHSTVINAVFELPNRVIKSIEADFGSRVLSDTELNLSKGYDNELTVGLSTNESIACDHLSDKANLPDEIKSDAKACNSLSDLNEVLANYLANKNGDVQEAKAKANALADDAQKQTAISAADKLAAPPQVAQLHSQVKGILDSNDLTLHIYDHYIEGELPRFLYFDEYYQMKGHLNIEKLKQRQANKKLFDSDRPMLGMIELARLDLDQLLNPSRTEELNNRLEGASNFLSRQVLKYWSQNKHLLVKFDVRPARPGDPEGMREGNNLWGRVHDSVHFVSTRLGTRSKGFIWFFSFLAWFSQQKKKNVPLILLLDEPGLFLHAMAQADLLNYIEVELAPHHQVLYTTHSPFMVKPECFDRIRIVEDKSIDIPDLPDEQRGTKVLTEALEASDDSLFPLQGALGFDIAQSLFVGPNCLIVEGVSDFLYLQCMSRILEGEGRTGLDSQWTITPVGGSGKVPTFVALLGAQKKLNIATLIDFATADKQNMEHLYQRKLLKKKKNVLTFVDFTGKAESDIEDLFEEDFYLKLVNGEYASNLSQPITASDIAGHNDRVLPRIEDFLGNNPMTGASFNHYRPARYFTENTESLSQELSTATLQRFENAFVALNGLL